MTAPSTGPATALSRRAPGLTARLLAAQLLVLAVAVLTAGVVASAVGPSIFRVHLGQVSHHDTPVQAAAHAEQAFRDASLISLGVALVAAVVVALAVSAYPTRLITRPVGALAAAAADVAAGRYDVIVPAPRLGREFDTLAASFASMAARIQDTELTRRRLLADLAHEMRTPVATLDAYLEAFEDGVAAADETTIGMLRGQTSRLSRLAEDVSAVSRAEEEQEQVRVSVAVQPRALVRAAVGAAAERYAAAGVELRADAPADLPEVRVDPDRFAQVLGNLLDNALRHTSPGGRVRVAARAVTAKAGEGPVVVLQVSDTGEGIPVQALPHVFERFYRVDSARDRAQGGSGIGLAIVKALVEADGGRVAATSAGPGRGATFTVTLPVWTPPR